MDIFLKYPNIHADKGYVGGIYNTAFKTGGDVSIINAEQTLALMKGQVLFEEGDPGGDLYIIQEGEIEVFRRNGKNTQRLSILKAGDLIGVMTCLTNDPRPAAARAVDETVVKKIGHSAIKKNIESQTFWMKMVLRDFALKINQLNASHTALAETLKESKSNQLSKLYTAAQVSSSFAEFGSFLAQKIGDQNAVYIDDAAALFAKTLNRPIEEILDIIVIFVDAGMVRTNVDQSNKGRYTTVKNCQSLQNFSAWAATAHVGRTKKLLQTQFSHKELRILSALVKFARKLDLNTKSKITLSIRDLFNSMEKAVGQKFEFESTLQATNAKLIETEGKGIEAKISFVPIDLSRALTHITIYKKLLRLQTKDDLRTGSKSAA